MASSNRRLGRTLQQLTAGASELEYASDPPCYFPTSPLPSTVLAVRTESSNSKVLTFSLPEGASLNLPVSSCVMLKVGPDKSGDDTWRPYNPISWATGSFELLVKRYSDRDREGRSDLGGILHDGGDGSGFCDELQVGDKVEFKQLGGNVKAFQYPFNKRKITMVCGGTGVTPMIQALHPILTTEGDTTEVRLIYGNNTTDDIMLKAELDAMEAAHPGQLTVTHVIAEDTAAGAGGWIDEAMLKRLAFPPAADSQIWVCGPPAMYDALAGSRMKKLAEGSALRNLGHTDDTVWRS